MAWDFAQVKANIRRTKDDLPKKLAAQAQKYFVGSWNKQGWDGNKWAEVQRRTPGTKTYKYATPSMRTNPILVSSGTLRRAVNNSIRKQTFTEIRLAVGDNEAPYAEYLNKGTDKMPKRQFMGQTNTLTGMQKKMIDKFFMSVWK
jgi:HK97 gp10 family phage protein